MMGPLVPDFINHDLNLIFAFFIGMGFGFLLEAAGFSSSKKLAGVFYGYDFTVIRVFFTAGVTAMVGILALSHYGLLDMDLIYINPLYLYSALLGGVIMGLGFIIGGFCPGTSMCASVIGKIDAMAFVAGIMLGIFIFIEGYPAFVDIYKGANYGIPQVSDTLNIPLGLFAFLSIIVAFGSYWLIAGIERKKNNGNTLDYTSKKGMIAITVVALFVGIFAATLEPEKEVLLKEVNQAGFIKSHKDIKTITPDELALRYILKDKSLQAVDTRDSKIFSKLTLPNAVNLTLEDFFSNSSAKVFNRAGKINILFGATDEDSKKAVALAKELGYNNVIALKGGFNNFKAQILEFKTPNIENLNDTQKFRAEASLIMPKLIEAAKPKVVKKVKVRALGGCG
jgi:rhodanese-related sulfurtransferase